MTTITIQDRVTRLAGLLVREREALAEFIAELADFDESRCWEPRFFHLSREEAKVLSVEFAPRDLVPLKEVVTRRGRPADLEPAPSTPLLSLVPSPSTAGFAASSPVHSVNCDDSKVVDRTGQARTTVTVQPESTQPMTGQLSRLHLTVSRELLAKIEAAQLALSHVHPNATIADILEFGADATLAQDAKRKGLVERPRSPRAETPPGSDHIPAHIRRSVWERDRGCCQWRLASGEVCGSRYRLQFDHIQYAPRGQRGGRRESRTPTLLGPPKIVPPGKSTWRSSLAATRASLRSESISQAGARPGRSRPCPVLARER